MRNDFVTTSGKWLCQPPWSAEVAACFLKKVDFLPTESGSIVLQVSPVNISSGYAVRLRAWDLFWSGTVLRCCYNPLCFGVNAQLVGCFSCWVFHCVGFLGIVHFLLSLAHFWPLLSLLYETFPNVLILDISPICSIAISVGGNFLFAAPPPSMMGGPWGLPN